MDSITVNIKAVSPEVIPGGSLYKLKLCGPKTEPWGTPRLISQIPEEHASMFTRNPGPEPAKNCAQSESKGLGRNIDKNSLFLD